jgi:hypothetical protein
MQILARGKRCAITEKRDAIFAKIHSRRWDSTLQRYKSYPVGGGEKPLLFAQHGILGNSKNRTRY